jgi:hypothetical protein
MGRRTAIPLYRDRHVAFVQAAATHPNRDKGLASLLQVGTGARVDTIGHVHADWFIYKPPKNGDKPPLYLKIPAEDDCRKGGDTEPCGDCNKGGHEKYNPKTPAGAGREILIDDTWTNPVTGDREDFPLRAMVEDYFGLDGTHAPDKVRYGNEMIAGNGMSSGQLNTWVRDVGAHAEISAELRDGWLREHIEIDEDRDQEQIKDFGTDEQGNEIPDIITHDLRATYCTHLMRNDVPRDKAINKTGHKVPQSMNPYISFANDEIDQSEETMFY